jgi:hypothetical protein
MLAILSIPLQAVKRTRENVPREGGEIHRLRKLGVLGRTHTLGDPGNLQYELAESCFSEKRSAVSHEIGQSADQDSPLFWLRPSARAV